MCLPLAAVAAIATVASTAVSAAGSLMAGAQAKAAGNYAARVNEQNARLASEQGKDAIDRGKIAARNLHREYGQIKGKQLAATGANGVDVDFGTPLDTQRDTAMLAGEDSATLYKNIDQEVKGYSINAANYRSQAQADRMGAKAAKTASLFAAGGTILSGVAQFAGLKQKFGAPK